MHMCLILLLHFLSQNYNFQDMSQPSHIVGFKIIVLLIIIIYLNYHQQPPFEVCCGLRFKF